MLFCINHNDRKIREQINTIVGKPYGFWERIKLSGIGSGRLSVHGFSENLTHYFGKTLDRKFVSIELRPKGILVYIKNAVNDYVWVIPYYKLVIYQTETVTFYADNYRIQLERASIFPKKSAFLDRILAAKLAYYQQYDSPLSA